MKNFIEVQKTHDRQSLLLSVKDIVSVEEKNTSHVVVVSRANEYFFINAPYAKIKQMIEEASK